jgi:RNA polymerase sigma-70 factor (ECF subfamily)
MFEPEPDVVRAAAAGDARAFERLVQDCQGPLRRYLRHLVGDAALAEDLTQEVLVKVYGRLHTYRFESRFMTWLLRIARNTAFDDQRSQMRRRQREQRALGTPPTHDPTVAGEIALALASLPIALREALLLVEVCGFTYAEAAQLQHVPEGTVKSRVHRAREGVARWYAEPKVGHG